MKKGILVVIPARLNSTRLPRKPLLDIHGFPMIYWVAHRVRLAGVVDYVVATDSDEIMNVCERYNIPAIKTSERCVNGTERVAEVATMMPYEYYCNVQGDEPLLDPSNLLAFLGVENRKEDVFYQAICPYESGHIKDYSVVKTVQLNDGNLPFFSRENIPYSRDGEEKIVRRKLLGLYLYSRKLLLHFSSIPAGPLESLEKVEQLRCIENKIDIKGILLNCSGESVDTPEDLRSMRGLKYERFLLA